MEYIVIICLSSMILRQDIFTTCQTILGDSSKHQNDVDNDVLKALRKFTIKFSAYQIDTQRELQALGKRLGIVETELEEIIDSKDKSSETQRNFTTGMCLMVQGLLIGNLYYQRRGNGTWSHLWFARVRECPQWCSIDGATVTVHRFFCILYDHEQVKLTTSLYHTLTDTSHHITTFLRDDVTLWILLHFQDRHRYTTAIPSHYRL